MIANSERVSIFGNRPPPTKREVLTPAKREGHILITLLFRFVEDSNRHGKTALILFDGNIDAFRRRMVGEINRVRLVHVRDDKRQSTGRRRGRSARAVRQIDENRLRTCTLESCFACFRESDDFAARLDDVNENSFR